MTSGSLVARGLAKSFGDLLVLADVDLHAEPDEVLAVLGPSGCGTSTLLRVLAGFETADAGELLVDGTAVAGPSPQRGMVAQAGGPAARRPARAAVRPAGSGGGAARGAVRSRKGARGARRTGVRAVRGEVLERVLAA